VSQVGSLKSLALRVLREGADTAGNEKSCPRAAIANGGRTGQELGQTVGQPLTVRARVGGQDAVVESSQAEVCWHCHGRKVCSCALCAVSAPQMQWQPGHCRACLGTGYLCWPESLQ
jgi:hypothetical protein